MGTQVMTVLGVAALATVGAAGCADDDGPEVPGLAPLGCTLGGRDAYAVTAADSARDWESLEALALDLDGPPETVGHNALGLQAVALHDGYPETWDPDGVAAARLTGGATRWVIEIERCSDADTVRVTSGRAVDADGDGLWTVVDHGVPSVGTVRGRAIATGRGIGAVPIGTLAAGSPTAATDDWQVGLALTTALVVGANRLDGVVGIALDPTAAALRTPVCRFMDERLAGGASTYAAHQDLDHDGVLEPSECDYWLDGELGADLDLGACDDVACYRPDHPDGVLDHASLGVGIHAEAIELELSGR